MFNYLLTLESVSDQVNQILNAWVGPLFIMIGACGGIWAVVMGVQYARCENDAKRAELKSRMVNCIIGVVIILVLGTCCIRINWAGVVQIFGYIWPAEDEDTAGKTEGVIGTLPQGKYLNIGKVALKLGIKAVRAIVIN